MKSIDFNDIEVQILSDENIKSIGDFDCGTPDLNSFIIDDALNQQYSLANITYLFFYDGKFEAYCTLAMDSITFEDEHQEKEQLLEEGIGYSTLPALKIARLAVCKSHQRKYGFGTHIIEWVFGGALELSDRIGCRYVTADAKRESIGFYDKIGFKHLLSEKEEKERDYPPVYFDLIILKKSKD